MAKFKVGDLVMYCTQIPFLVRGVDEETAELWIRGDEGNRTVAVADCTLYVPPPEIGRRYRNKAHGATSITAELVALRDGLAIMYTTGTVCLWHAEHLIPE